jgi:hypothetical protein
MDLDFVAGNFIYGDLPKDKEYLSHYFNTDVERAFLSYFFTFPSLYRDTQFRVFYHSFCDHTGYFYSTRWVRKLLVRLNKIEKALMEAEKNFDLSRVGEIKGGTASF